MHIKLRLYPGGDDDLVAFFDGIFPRLRAAMVKPDGEVVIRCTPDALDGLLAAVAAAANHCESRKLERRLDKLYDRLDAFERTLLIVGEEG